MGETVKVDVYSNDKVGGRIAVVEYGGRQYEAGASILHKDNQYMAGFARMFGEWESLLVMLAHARVVVVSVLLLSIMVVKESHHCKNHHGQRHHCKNLWYHTQSASMLPKNFVMSIPSHTEMFRDSHHLL